MQSLNTIPLVSKVKLSLALGRDLVELAYYMRRNYAPSFGWSDERIMPWLGWFCHHGLIATAKDGRTLSYCGFLLGRPCREPVLCAKWEYAHCWEGPIFYVDILFVESPFLIDGLWSTMETSLGEKEKIAFCRDFRSTIRLLDSVKFKSKLKEKYGPCNF